MLNLYFTFLGNWEFFPRTRTNTSSCVGPHDGPVRSTRSPGHQIRSCNTRFQGFAKSRHKIARTGLNVPHNPHPVVKATTPFGRIQFLQLYDEGEETPSDGVSAAESHCGQLLRAEWILESDVAG